MVVTDISETNDRIDLLGKLGACYGCGVMVGVFVSNWCYGYMSDELDASFAAVGTVLCLIIVCIYIPRNTKCNIEKVHFCK